MLGVARDASATTIRRRYLELARQYHPDVQRGPDQVDAERRMREITAAWSVLGDAERRSRYDDDLARADAPAGQPYVRRTPFRPYDADDPDDDRDERFDAVRIGDDLTDESLGTGAAPPRVLTILPPALLVLGLAALSAGLVASFGPLLALGLVALVGAALSFVAAPVTAIFLSRRSEEEP